MIKKERLRVGRVFFWETPEHSQMKIAAPVKIQFVDPSSFAMAVELDDGMVLHVHSNFKLGERDVLSELTELDHKEIEDNDPGC